MGFPNILSVVTNRATFNTADTDGNLGLSKAEIVKALKNNPIAKNLLNQFEKNPEQAAIYIINKYGSKGTLNYDQYLKAVNDLKKNVSFGNK